MRVAFIALVGTFTNQYLNNADTGSVEVIVLVFVISVWVWVWRRYHRPLLYLIPTREYDRFNEWREGGKPPAT